MSCDLLNSQCLAESPQNIPLDQSQGGGLRDSFLVDGVAFKKTFSYAGFEMQPKQYEVSAFSAHVPSPVLQRARKGTTLSASRRLRHAGFDVQPKQQLSESGCALRLLQPRFLVTGAATASWGACLGVQPDVMRPASSPHSCCPLTLHQAEPQDGTGAESRAAFNYAPS